MLAEPSMLTNEPDAALVPTRVASDVWGIHLRKAEGRF